MRLTITVEAVSDDGFRQITRQDMRFLISRDEIPQTKDDASGLIDEAIAICGRNL